MSARELDALAERVEQATPEQQRDMLGLAWTALHPGPIFGTDQEPLWGRFLKMLCAEAYESAAMSLVPEGLSGRLSWCAGAAAAEVYSPGKLGAATGTVAAATPALALTAAALRALASDQRNV